MINTIWENAKKTGLKKKKNTGKRNQVEIYTVDKLFQVTTGLLGQNMINIRKSLTKNIKQEILWV
jgi:hypothetical protein